MPHSQSYPPSVSREAGAWGMVLSLHPSITFQSMEIPMSKLQQNLLAGAGIVVGSIASAHAALPAEATAAFTTISGNVTDVLAAMWPIVALATGGFVLVKLFKKGANKAV